MKVSREQAAENRERVLSTAARLFRERGFDGVGLADIMKTAGLTHGGFYGQFSSKEDLVVQACSQAMAEAGELWQRLATASPEAPLQAIAAQYLSPDHHAGPGTGCLLATLGAEVARQPALVRASVRQGVLAVIDRFATWLPGRNAAARRHKAMVTYASMVGAMVLARAVDDEALSAEILQAVAGALPVAAVASVKEAQE